jgi:predicted MFS family arabinose efflux permease
MAVNMPSRQAILSEILPDDKLMNGIAMQSSAMSVTSIVGPIVAGILILYIDTAGVFFIVAGGYLLSVAAVSVIKAGGQVQSASSKGVGGDIRAGIAYVTGNSVLLGLVIMAFIPVMFGMSYFVLIGPWAREALDVGAEDLGILMTTMGVGALVGSLALASLRRFKSRGAVLLVMCVAWGVALAAFGQATSYAVALPLLFFVGVVSAVYRSLSMTMLQLYATPEMRGRVMSIAMMTFGLMPLSAVPFGIIAERFGTPEALTLSGILLAAATILFAIAYPSFRRVP